ncbi:UNVERIFIED_CONTAM: hypothetical protein Sradi_4464600 [Sesamum radiatum]|uniref:DUF2470 domain-containing protein n=1 Tax=Sesamum radiatum TaxID=300843 RepID=A0AAW2NSH4_SESRA
MKRSFLVQQVARSPSLPLRFVSPSSYCFINGNNKTPSHLSRSLTSPFKSQIRRASVSPLNQNASDVKDAVNVFQLIQAHQEKAARLPPIEEIRTLLHYSLRGVLSTFSLKYAGYPSGSMVDFACDAYGSPLLAVSNLAVHTKDLLANPKCSLLVARDPEDRTDLVIIVHGDAIPVNESDKEAIRTAYLTRHPNAFWVDFGDFQFLRIEPKVVRYVSGVATALLGSGEFSNDEFRTARVDPIYQFSKPIASHMNKDHAEDTRLIVQHSTSVPVEFAYMMDIDSLGFNVKLTTSSSSSSRPLYPAKGGCARGPHSGPWPRVPRHHFRTSCVRFGFLLVALFALQKVAARPPAPALSPAFDATTSILVAFASVGIAALVLQADFLISQSNIFFARAAYQLARTTSERLPVRHLVSVHSLIQNAHVRRGSRHACLCVFLRSAPNLPLCVSPTISEPADASLDGKELPRSALAL